MSSKLKKNLQRHPVPRIPILALPFPLHGCWRSAVFAAAAVLGGVAMLHVHLSLCGAIFNLSQGELCLCLSCLAVHTKNYLCSWKKGVPVLFWDLEWIAVFIAKNGGEEKCSSSQNLWHQVLVVAEQSSISLLVFFFFFFSFLIDMNNWCVLI